MKTTNEAGQQVEIPTLQEDAEGNACVSSLEDMLLLVQCMGWESIAAFEEEAGPGGAQDLVGKWWTVVGGRIYLRE